jgi:hypothetical protein
MGINKPIDTAGSLGSALLAEYERLEEFIRSGTLTPAQTDLLMQKNQSFADWMRTRASARLRSE